MNVAFPAVNINVFKQLVYWWFNVIGSAIFLALTLFRGGFPYFFMIRQMGVFFVEYI